MSEFKGDILKVRLGDDTRRMVLFNTNISYDDLVLMLQRVFDGKLRSEDEVTLKYVDEDDDLITIADAGDFAHAREYAVKGIIKMIIFVNGRDIRTSLAPQQVKGLRKELYEVRDKVNALVDALADTPLITQTQPNTTGQVPRLTTAPPTVVTEATSMFDPLNGSGDPTITTSPVSQLATTTIDTVTTLTATGPPASSLFPNQQGGGAQFLDQSQPTGRSPSPLTSQAPPTTSQQPQGYNYQQPGPNKGYTQAPYSSSNQPYSTHPTAQPTAPPTAQPTAQPTAPPTAPPSSNTYQQPPSSAPGYPPSSTPSYPPSSASYPPGNTAYQQPSAGNYAANYAGGPQNNAYQPPTGGYPSTQGQPPRSGYGYGASRANPYKVGY